MAAYVVKAALRTVTPLCMGYGSCSIEIWNLREILSQLKKKIKKIDAFTHIKLKFPDRQVDPEVLGVSMATKDFRVTFRSHTTFFFFFFWCVFAGLADPQNDAF